MTAYYKMRQRLLQNATVVLRENGTKIYYKMRQVFLKKYDSFAKNATVLLGVIHLVRTQNFPKK